MKIRKFNTSRLNVSLEINKVEKSALKQELEKYIAKNKFYTDDSLYWEKLQNLGICLQILKKKELVAFFLDDKPMAFSIVEMAFLANMETDEVIFDAATLEKLQKNILKLSKV